LAVTNSKKVIDFLALKWQNRNCPMCGSGPWEVQDKTFQLNEFHSGNFVVGGPLIPIIPVTCMNCGHTVLVNAIVAGALSPEAEPQEKK
jgi:predicted nucleic-acid-binding Zn-ribbon protein